MPLSATDKQRPVLYECSNIHCRKPHTRDGKCGTCCAPLVVPPRLPLPGAPS